MLMQTDAPATKRRKQKHRSHNFAEGWVEFVDKKVARHVAEFLNGQPIGTWGTSWSTLRRSSRVASSSLVRPLADCVLRRQEELTLARRSLDGQVSAALQVVHAVGARRSVAGFRTHR